MHHLLLNLPSTKYSIIFFFRELLQKNIDDYIFINNLPPFLNEATIENIYNVQRI